MMILDKEKCLGFVSAVSWKVGLYTLNAVDPNITPSGSVPFKVNVKSACAQNLVILL